MDRKVLIILAVGVALRLLSFAGLMGSDDLIYNKAAYNLTTGEDFALGNPGQNRLGLIFPLATMFKLWGVNEVSSSLVVFIPSLLLILLTFYVGRHFFGKEVGYVAALLQAIYPMDVLFATLLYPDLPTALFVGLAVYLFHRGCNDKGDLHFFASGLSVGLAYSVKETGAFAAPFLVGYALYNIRKKGFKWGYVWTLVGFMAVFISELIFFHAMKGDMLYRFHSLSVHNEGPWSGLPGYLEYGYWKRLTYRYPKIMLFYWPHFGLFYWLTFAAMIYLLMVREKRAYFPMVWWLAFYLTLNFASTSLTRYIPLPTISRYSFILVLPANLTLACALQRLTREAGLQRFARVVGYSALMVLLLSSIFIVAKKHARGSYTERAITAYFTGKPDRPIYTDPRTITVLEYYFKYQNTDMLRDFTDVEWEKVKDSYVLLNMPRIRFLNTYYKMLFHPILFDPPPSWRTVAVFSPDRGPDGQPMMTKRGAIIYLTGKK